MSRVIEIEEQKKIMLAMMDYIDTFCKKNHIRYFLYGGSLIGAIRHQGFIPWDDDIDICMMRKDYDLFLSMFEDQSGRYCLISPANNPAFYLPTAKVYDSATVLNERVPGGIDIGVFIDVFPLDYYSDDYTQTCKYGNKIGRYRKIVDIKNIAISKRRKMNRNAALLCLKALVWPIPKRFAIKRILNLSSKYKQGDTKYVGQFTKMIYSSNEIFESEWFNESIDASFENRIYCIPKEYDKVLKNIYGDYLKMPPKDKQVTHHSNYAWWK